MIEYDRINFNYNWNNKLNCKSYTTIRVYNKVKYVLNFCYGIYLKKEYLHTSQIVDIKNFKLKDISNFMAYLDTGYSKEETIDIIRKMYKNDSLDLVYSFILLNKITEKKK